MATRGSRPDTRTSIKHFRGLLTNADPHDLPPGAAQEQNNIQVLKAGVAEVRKGMLGVTFANAITATTNEILATHAFNPPHARFIVYLDTAGNLKAGRNPSV